MNEDRPFCVDGAKSVGEPDPDRVDMDGIEFSDFHHCVGGRELDQPGIVGPAPAGFVHEAVSWNCLEESP